MKAALDSINDEREQNLAKVLSRRELPREPINHRSRTSYNYNSGKTGSKSGHKLSLLEKIRKEARDARNARIHQPTSVLVKQHAEVKKAPQGLVDDYKRSAQQKASTPTITRSPAAPRISKPPLAISRQDKSTTGMSFQEREERLRALTAGKSMPDPKSASTNNELKTSGTSQLSSRLRKPMPQNDGVVDDEDDEEPQPHATIRASSPPERRMGTPPIPRLGSPVPSLKRKAEPSIFMSAKKPKPPR